MPVEVGTVAVMKTTGDRVFVAGKDENRNFVIRVPFKGHDGTNSYELLDEILPNELCTVEEYFNMISEEMFLKSCIQKKLLDRAKVLDTEEAITAA